MPSRLVKAHWLSIAPFWNWNGLKVFIISAANFALNRTILELKLIDRIFLSTSSNLSIAPFWNWNTIFRRLSRRCASSLNRTILELKPGRKRRWRVGIYLSIAPFWNWNEKRKRLIIRCLCSQSHHFGIETRFSGGFHAGAHRSQSHHFGIETDWLRRRGVKSYILSIAPFWNWNGRLTVRFGDVVNSQSHHFGIETEAWFHFLDLRCTSQSHHFGIET